MTHAPAQDSSADDAYWRHHQFLLLTDDHVQHFATSFSLSWQLHTVVHGIFILAVVNLWSVMSHQQSTSSLCLAVWMAANSSGTFLASIKYDCLNGCILHASLLNSVLIMFVSVCLYVCVCVRHTPVLYQIMPHDIPGTLVLWHTNLRRNSKAITPYGGDKCRWGGLKLATFDEKRAVTREWYKIEDSFFYSRIGSRMCSIKWWCFRWPWVTPNPPNHLNFAFFVAFHIFIVSKHRNFIFGVQVDGS